ncbi:sle1_055 (plasmid) [Streptomyces leeuwenhoekii]|uniref:Sle1_055 protein n=1 Tax=Streptomyces leeuwenhoekii TaxID=1437453 RepID=A0A0F7VPB7_STRLW|nr:sle1_055 [Streptomyces leeuwenhoekii]
MNAYLAGCLAIRLGHQPGYATHLRTGRYGPTPVQEIPT